MRFLAEYYLRNEKRVAPEVIEAEDINGAIDEAEGAETDNKVLFSVTKMEWRYMK